MNLLTRPLAYRCISKLLLNTDDLNNANKTFKFMYVCMYVCMYVYTGK